MPNFATDIVCPGETHFPKSCQFEHGLDIEPMFHGKRADRYRLRTSFAPLRHSNAPGKVLDCNRLVASELVPFQRPLPLELQQEML